MLRIILLKNAFLYNITFSGSIGGHLGLFIGCSVLTAFEFLECILMSTLYHCKRQGSRACCCKRKDKFTPNKLNVAPELDMADNIKRENEHIHEEDGRDNNGMVS